MESQTKRPLKIKAMMLQLDFKLKQVDYNLERVGKSLASIKQEEAFDVIMIPEMAFTGYNFFSAEDVKPYAEKQGEGKIFNFLSEWAVKLNSYVVAGYPELHVSKKGNEVFYNSAYLVGRDGKLVLNYRKHFLFESDKLWSQSGDCFKAVEMTNLSGQKFKAAIGICMDINPKDFGDQSLFEFANFCKQQEVDVILFIAGWLDHEPSNNSLASVMGIIDYWKWRLYPLENRDKKKDKNRSILFLCCNRVGKEINSISKTTKDEGLKGEFCHFHGASCALKLNPNELVYYLDKKEGILKTESILE